MGGLLKPNRSSALIHVALVLWEESREDAGRRVEGGGFSPRHGSQACGGCAHLKRSGAPPRSLRALATRGSEALRSGV